MFSGGHGRISRWPICEVLLMGALFVAVITVGRMGLLLAIDSETGDMLSLSYRGEEILRSGPGEVSLDFLVNHKWPRRGHVSRLASWHWDEREGILTIRRRIGDWEAEEVYKFWAEKPRIERLLRLKFLGQGEQKIRRVLMGWPGVDISWAKGVCWVPRGPGLRAKFSELQKLGGGYVIMQIAPHLSLLFTNEPRREPTWIVVERGRGRRAKICQVFEALGFVYPWETHEIGPCYLTVVEGDAKRALEAIWEWFLDVGLKVPEDRPGWVYNSVLYSFHPGGTIGSNCLDLGASMRQGANFCPSSTGLG